MSETNEAKPWVHDEVGVDRSEVTCPDCLRRMAEESQCGCRFESTMRPPTMILCPTHAEALETELEQEPRLISALIRMAEKEAR